MALERVPLGVKKLDEALEGGIPKGSWVLVASRPLGPRPYKLLGRQEWESSKNLLSFSRSILAIQFASAGLRAGDPVIYITTEQDVHKVLEIAGLHGMYLGPYTILRFNKGDETTFRIIKRAVYRLSKAGRIDAPIFMEEPIPRVVFVDIFSLTEATRRILDRGVRSHSIYAVNAKALVEAIRAAYKELRVRRPGTNKPHRHVRLAIDSLSTYWAGDPVMVAKFNRAVKRALRDENLTVLFTSHYPYDPSEAYKYGLDQIADGVIDVWRYRYKEYVTVNMNTPRPPQTFAYRIEPEEGFILVEKVDDPTAHGRS